MTIDDHPEEVIATVVNKSLEQNGFVPGEYNPALPRNLKVEIRLLSILLGN